MYFWENSGSHVMVQYSLNQSYLSILISIQLVSQISLPVCQFVCLYLLPFLKMMDFWGIAEVVTSIKKITRAVHPLGWRILSYFCPVLFLLTFLFFLRTALLKVWRTVRGVTLIVTTHKKNCWIRLSSGADFGLFLGSIWCMF